MIISLCKDSMVGRNLKEARNILAHPEIIKITSKTSSWNPCEATSEILPSWIRSSTGSERNFGAPKGRKRPATEGFHPPKRNSSCPGPSRFALETLRPGRNLQLVATKTTVAMWPSWTNWIKRIQLTNDQPQSPHYAYADAEKDRLDLNK